MLVVQQFFKRLTGNGMKNFGTVIVLTGSAAAFLTRAVMDLTLDWSTPAEWAVAVGSAVLAGSIAGTILTKRARSHIGEKR